LSGLNSKNSYEFLEFSPRFYIKSENPFYNQWNRYREVTNSR
jgi:hypothetical protein